MYARSLAGRLSRCFIERRRKARKARNEIRFHFLPSLRFPFYAPTFSRWVSFFGTSSAISSAGCGGNESAGSGGSESAGSGGNGWAASSAGSGGKGNGEKGKGPRRGYRSSGPHFGGRPRGGGGLLSAP